MESIKQRKIFHSIRESVIHDFFSYIETWENLGDLNSPKYSGSLLNTADYHQFDNIYAGEVFIVLASNSNMKIMEPNQTE